MLIVLTLACSLWSGVVVGEDSDIPPLTSRDYLRSAAIDAETHFGLPLTAELENLEFSVFHGFFEDLDNDGQSELIVAGDIIGKNVYYVLAFHWDRQQWRCEVLNRSLGGGIQNVQLVDCDADGHSEIFSVLTDEAGRKSCSIYRFSAEEDRFVPAFEVETESGFQVSYNFMLFHPEGSRTYRLRVDKAVYPEEDGGAVQTETAVYQMEDGKMVSVENGEGR